MKRIITFSVLACLSVLTASAQKVYSVVSPSGKLQTTVTAGEELTYNVLFEGREVLVQSPLAMTLEDGTVWGRDVKVRRAVKGGANHIIPAEFYRESELKEQYNSLTLNMKGGWSVEFRAYDDGMAYRFVCSTKEPFRVVDETVSYCFAADHEVVVPYVLGGKDHDWESQFFSSFENLYSTENLSEMNNGRLSFLPLAVNLGNGLKMCITEVNLENYPGLYLYNSDGSTSLEGMFAMYPSHVEAGGYNDIQGRVIDRHTYMASVDSPRTFPWRAIVVGEDVDLAESDMTYLLAEPSRIADTSWIKPGMVAWDWWNNWDITGVDFRAGVNTETYMYYVDFAAEKGLKYFLIDDGWSVGKGEDLMKINPEIDLQEVIDYAASKDVGILLWAGYMAFHRDMEEICRHYSEMGVKGFKVDFMDRDDQMMTDFNYRAAQMTAEYGLILDLHGTHKPAGLTRTWPNVLNVEGVHGLETAKFRTIDSDQMEYDVTVPFIRQVSGPMDYTPGAMRNATKKTFRMCHEKPMSQGTRCHQMGLYVVIDSPLCMMCDTPVNYRHEAECADFIAGIPTVWDETKVLSGSMGEYVVMARRRGDVWYVGGLTDWDARSIRLDLSSLGTGARKVEIFRDGVNADLNAEDYRRDEIEADLSVPMNIDMAPGGGFAMKISTKIVEACRSLPDLK